MERLIMLRKEAAALRALALRVDMQPLRDQLLDLALRCEELAKSMEENPPAAPFKPNELLPDLH
jgi:hypothetical protein